MSELIGLDHVSIASEGSTLSMGIEAPQWIGVYGPGGSGKSKLLSVMAGRERPSRGTVRVQEPVSVAEPVPNPRRARPFQLARRGRGPHFASIATEALLATRLWEIRNSVVSQLSDSQMAACELLPVLTSGASCLILDGHLDRLDPWALAATKAYLRLLQTQGVGMVAATNRPDLAQEFDAILVLREQEVVFAGPPDDLIRASGTHTFVVTAVSQPAVQAIVKPFSVSMREEKEGLVLKAEEGQEVAANLLLQGYGNVKCAVHRPPTMEEALLALIR